MAENEDLKKKAGLGDLVYLAKKIANSTILVVKSQEGGYYLIDKNKNIGFQVVGGKVDALGFGENLTKLIKEIALAGVDLGKIEKSITDNTESIDKNTEDIESINSVTRYLDSHIKESGFYLIDENKNIGFQVVGGKIDAIDFGSNLYAKLRKLITSLAPSSSTSSSASVNFAESYNESYAELMQLKDETQNAVNSLLTLKNTNGNTFSKTITIPASTIEKSLKHGVFRLGLHYGSQLGSTIWNEIFFGGNVNKNFSDIRFKDSHGNIIPCRMLHSGNYEVVRDFNFGSSDVIADESRNLYTLRNGVISKSENGGKTWSVLSGQPFKYTFIKLMDSKGGIWATGNDSKVYVCYPSDGVYNFENQIEVADLNYSNGEQNTNSPYASAIKEDSAGYVYIGQYQKNMNAVIFRTILPLTANGVVASEGKYTYECYNQPRVYQADGETLDYDKVDQHVHHLDIFKAYDKDGNIVDNIIAGLDNSQGKYGPNLISSIDHGKTWISLREILSSQDWLKQHGHDYTFTWMSSDNSYTITTGEVNILGGMTLWKMLTKVDDSGRILPTGLVYPLNTGHGIRKVVSDGDDFIVTCCCGGGISNRTDLLLSEDGAKTWKSIYTETLRHTVYSAGVGGRYFLGPIKANGAESSDKCWYINGFGTGPGATNYSPLRLYKGGDHYYGECLIALDNIEAGQDIIITCESGYAMAYPNSQLFNRNEVKAVWSLPLNEGNGSVVTDSDGNKYSISGEFEWDTPNNTMRYSQFVPNIKNYREVGGLRLKKGSSIHIGSIPKLKFSKGFSIVLWIAKSDFVSSDFGDIGLSVNYDSFFPIINSESFRFGTMRTAFFAGGKSKGTYTRGANVPVCNVMLYNPYLVTISNDDVPTISSIRGDELEKTFTTEKATSWPIKNLSESDITIGTSDTTGTDVNKDYFIHSISIYDRILTREEFMSIWNGHSFTTDSNNLK